MSSNRSTKIAIDISLTNATIHQNFSTTIEHEELDQKLSAVNVILILNHTTDFKSLLFTKHLSNANSILFYSIRNGGKIMYKKVICPKYADIRSESVIGVRAKFIFAKRRH